MKIALINGSPRKKGNTYHAAKLFLDNMSKFEKVTCVEYFLPWDLPEFCVGCANCFDKGEDKCPHAQYTLPILNSMIEADALIFATPVYVWNTTGAMKNFLDHFGHLFLVHRPKEEMFLKKAFVLSTASGGLKKSAIKPVAANLKQWGINRVYSAGFILKQLDHGTWNAINEKRRGKIEKIIEKKAKRFYRDTKAKKRRPYLFTRIMFCISRRMIKKDEGRLYDKAYWKEKGWMKKNPL